MNEVREWEILRPAPTRREPNAYGPKHHKAVDARLDNCPTRRCLACLKSGASCSTLLATERSWPCVLATAPTHWSITIGSLWQDASSGRWGRVAAGSQLHTDACFMRLVGAGLYWTHICSKFSNLNSLLLFYYYYYSIIIITIILLFLIFFKEYSMIITKIEVK